MATNRFVDDIRKIVNIDPNQSKFRAADSKPTIQSRAGVSYRNADGQGTTGTVSAPNQPLPPVPQTGVIPGKDTGNLGDKGNKVDPHNPTNSSYGPTSGVFQAEGLLDGTEGPVIQDGSQNGLGDYLDNKNGTLNGLEGLTDCDTGKDLSLRFDGLAVPPDGWYDADTPPDFPIEGQTHAGSFWRFRFLFNDTQTISGAFCVQSITSTGKPTLAEAQADYLATHVSLSSFDSASAHDMDYCNPTGGFLSGALCKGTYSNDTQQYFFFERYGCTPGVGLCPITNITKDPNEHWPADGKMQLIYENGKWVGHAREPAADKVPKFGDNSHSRIDFCFGSGRTGAVTPGINGGFAIGETTGGVFTGDVRYYSAGGKLETVLKQDEIGPYLP